jgi:hypothetical protein
MSPSTTVGDVASPERVARCGTRTDWQRTPANLRPGEDVADAVLREKDRENALRRMGFRDRPLGLDRRETSTSR